MVSSKEIVIIEMRQFIKNEVTKSISYSLIHLAVLVLFSRFDALILFVVSQISGEYGQKSTVRGLSRGPGPGGGRNTNIGLVAKSLDATPEGSSSSRVNRTVATTYREKSISGTDADRVPQEIFFLHAEEGYFGCQVNESTDVLQLYDVSKLCNGASECYLGSDENRAKLKCTSKLKPSFEIRFEAKIQ